nr:tombus P33-like protein [Tolivirales sp.]
MSNQDSPSFSQCVASVAGGAVLGGVITSVLFNPRGARNIKLFAAGAAIGYCATKAAVEYFNRDAPLRGRVELFLLADEDERLAEECVTDMVLDSSTLLRETETVIMAPKRLQWEGPTEVVTEVAPTCGEEVAESTAGSESVDADDTVVEEATEVTPSKVCDATPNIEVRNSRALIGTFNRMTYSRKVYDACKVKFGTPKNTEANYKAVWRYAGQLMKEHGVRPSHQASVLPGLVSKVFVPTVEEMLASRENRVMRDMMEERFDECVSRWDRWARKCKRFLGLD